MQKMLIAAKGVEYLENQWCVLDWDAKDMSTVAGSMDWACSRADCSPLLKGASCSSLQKDDKASYAFNMYFQMQGQDMAGCDFKGLGRITNKNASTPNCVFPIQINAATHPLTIALPTTLLALALLLLAIL